VQNVVTYTTVVDFDNPDTKLYPGMTAYVNIPVASANNVVRVPNGALRYKPDLDATQVSTLLQQAGISADAGRTRKSGQAGQQSQEQAQTAVVWKLGAKKSLEPVQIKLGITDHTNTEVAQVLKGSLNPGDQVITGAAASSQKAGATAAPGMGGSRSGGMRGMGR